MDEVKQAAAILGALGGSRNTKAQNRARARNGQFGGRPRIRKSTEKKSVAEPDRSGKLHP